MSDEEKVSEGGRLKWSGILWPELLAAIERGPGAIAHYANGKSASVHPRDEVTGSENYRLMSLATAVLIDPSPARVSAYLSRLDAMHSRDGHLTTHGPRALGYECGAPGMHWTFSMTAPEAVAQKGLAGELGPKSADLAAASLQFLNDEYRFDAHFVYGGRCTPPAPRVKDQLNQGPLDGYRDAWIEMLQGRPVKRSAHWWAAESAIACRLMRDLIAKYGAVVLAPLTANALSLPLLPVKYDRSPPGADGFVAWIIDEPPAHELIDVCHRVSNTKDGVTYWCDWHDDRPAGHVGPGREPA